MTSSIDTIIAAARSYLPSLDESRVRAAYEFAERAHEGQVRFSGDPYIVHPLEAAGILLSLKPDEDTLIATLLHDVPSDTSVSLAMVEKAFGREVARLVQGTGKLGLVKMQGGQSQVESWRRMFLAMAKDLRVIFIKLSERLHNMRTLEYVAPHKQLRIAQETLRVYAPIASRLGIYALKSELEDLCFKFIHPKEYGLLRAEIEAHGRVNERCMEEAKRVFRDFLRDEGIEAEVSGRIKHLYSIYRKLRKKNTSRLSDVHDLFAIRIVLQDTTREGREFVGPCYTTLGALHSRWLPMPGRFKDYIAVPKLNGYRSLHTTLVGLLTDLASQPVEVQIRTESMHRESEYGIASHWWYEDSRRASSSLSRDEVEAIVEERRLMAKLHAFLNEFPEERSTFEALLSGGKTVKNAPADALLLQALMRAGFSEEEWMRLCRSGESGASGRSAFFQHQVDWLVGLEPLSNATSDDVEGNECTDVSFFEDRIFVLTPQGDLKDLPAGSTPIDFAYAIHSDVGNRCYQVKVNGKIASLDTELLSGDIVEVLTRKHPAPNRYWLSFVKTSQAASKIKAWFRALDREKNIKAGRMMLNKALKSMSKPPLGPNFNLLKHYGGHNLDFPHREHIVEQVGDGTITVNHVLRTLFSESDLLGARVDVTPVHQPVVPALAPSANADLSDVLITGERDLPFTLSACCAPRYPLPIVGYVTRGKTIRIHRHACRDLTDIDPERLLEASWLAASSLPLYQVRLRLESEDRVGLLKDIVDVVTGLEVSIRDFPLVERQGTRVVRDLILDVPNLDFLTRLIYRLEAVDHVVRVSKV